MTACTASITLKVLDERIRPYFPAYTTSGSAGLDLRACVDVRETSTPDRLSSIANRHSHPYRRSRPRGCDPSALGSRPQARYRPRQPGRTDRFRLSGPADGELLEPRCSTDRCSRWSGSRNSSSSPSCRAAFDVVDLSRPASDPTPDSTDRPLRQCGQAAPASAPRETGRREAALVVHARSTADQIDYVRHEPGRNLASDSVAVGTSSLRPVCRRRQEVRPSWSPNLHRSTV